MLLCRVGGDAAKARKVAAMQNDVSALEAALSAAQLEYERVKARNLQVGCGVGVGWSLHCGVVTALLPLGCHFFTLLPVPTRANNWSPGAGEGAVGAGV